jgi:hypothetical protein
LRHPVVFAFGSRLPQHLAGFRAAQPGPFVILVPAAETAEHLAPALDPQESITLVLGDFVPPAGPGRFEAQSPLGTLVRPWLAAVLNRPSRNAFSAIQTELRQLRRIVSSAPGEPPEPLGAGEARRLFALLKQLEPVAGTRKAPLLLVFRLYCLEGLPASVVARRCGCSKTLVIARIAELGRKLGRHPARLRALSGHVEQLEKDMTDPRARDIYRPAAAEILEPEEDED